MYRCWLISKLARDLLTRHLRRHGEEVSSGVIENTSIPCDACHDRKIKCTGGNPCRTCHRHGIECTRRREVKRKRPTWTANRNYSERLVQSEPHPPTSAQPSEILVASTISDQEGAIGFAPNAPREASSARSNEVSTKSSSVQHPLPRDLYVFAISAASSESILRFTPQLTRR
jgi:hypothetical protein